MTIISVDGLVNAIVFTCPDCSKEIALEIAGLQQDGKVVLLAYCTNCKIQLRYFMTNIKDELVPPLVCAEARRVM